RAPRRIAEEFRAAVALVHALPDALPEPSPRAQLEGACERARALHHPSRSSSNALQLRCRARPMQSRGGAGGGRSRLAEATAVVTSGKQTFYHFLFERGVAVSVEPLASGQVCRCNN